MELMGASNLIPNTSLYRKSKAQRAWFSLKGRRDGVGGCCDAPFNSQVTEEFLNLSFAHCLWMPYVMENDVALDPVDVGLLG
jgi:hypothetical protein